MLHILKYPFIGISDEHEHSELWIIKCVFPCKFISGAPPAHQNGVFKFQQVVE